MDDLTLYRCTHPHGFGLQHTTEWCHHISGVDQLSPFSMPSAATCYFSQEWPQNASIQCFVEGIPLSLISSEKYMGILINSDLSWSPHVSNLCSKVRKLVALLYWLYYNHADSATLIKLSPVPSWLYYQFNSLGHLSCWRYWFFRENSEIYFASVPQELDYRRGAMVQPKPHPCFWWSGNARQVLS